MKKTARPWHTHQNASFYRRSSARVHSPAPIAANFATPRLTDLQALYEEHAAFVRRLARHLLGPARDPDDVTQEVFLLAWRLRHEYRGGSTRAWLGQMTLLICAHERRRGRLWRFLGLEHAADVPAPGDPELSAEAREAMPAVDAALQSMPERQRVVFVLFEIHGFSGKEIAEMLGCPEGTVHTRLFHGRRAFFERVDPELIARWSGGRSSP